MRAPAWAARALVLLALAALGAGCSKTRRWQASDRWPRTSANVKFNLPTVAGELAANGVRWVIMPDPTAALVEVDVRVDVGAAADPEGKRGLAHLVEHLMFQQRPGGGATPRLGSLVRRATVAHNAYTTEDATHYQNLALPGALDAVIGLEAARFRTGCAGIDEAGFAREREVVRNELRERGADDDAASLRHQVHELVFGAGHPYARGVGGSDAEVASITLAEACKFIQDHYTPARLIVVVAGKLDPEATEAALRREFATLADRQARPHPTLPALALRPGRVTREATIDEPMVIWAFEVPARFEDLAPEVELAVERLGDALDEAFRGDAAVQETFVALVGGPRARAVVVGVELDDEAAIARVEDELGDVLAGLPAKLNARRDRLAHVGEELRQRFVMRSLFTLESLTQRADLIADYLHFAPDRRFGQEIAHTGDKLAQWGRMTSATDLLARPLALRMVFRPAKQRTGGPRRAQVAFQGSAPEQQDGIDVDASEARGRLALPEERREQPAHRFTLPNGLTVVLQPASSLLPLVTTRLVFAVGAAHEPAQQAGLAQIAGLVLQYGTYASTSRLFEDAAAGLHRRPARLAAEDTDESLDVTHDHTMLTIRHLSNDTPEVLHTLAFRLNAEVDPSPIDRLLDVLEKVLAQHPRGNASITGFALDAALHGPHHPYARTAGMTLRSLLRIDTDDVLAFFHEHYVAANATLIIAGNFVPELLEAGIRDEFGRWNAGEPTPPVAAARRARHAALFLGVANAGEGDEEHDPDQLVLALGYPAGAGIDGQHAARLVLTRMIQLRVDAVRERLGATYGLDVSLSISVGPGKYVVRGLVDAARAGESLALVRAGIAALRRGADFDQDFARARRLVLAELLGKAASSHALASDWSIRTRFDLPDDHHLKLVRLVANLAPAQVRELVDAELVPEREVVVVTGTRAAVERTYEEAGLAPPQFMKRWPPRDDD